MAAPLGACEFEFEYAGLPFCAHTTNGDGYCLFNALAQHTYTQNSSNGVGPTVFPSGRALAKAYGVFLEKKLNGDELMPYWGAIEGLDPENNVLNFLNGYIDTLKTNGPLNTNLLDNLDVLLLAQQLGVKIVTFKKRDSGYYVLDTKGQGNQVYLLHKGAEEQQNENMFHYMYVALKQTGKGTGTSAPVIDDAQGPFGHFSSGKPPKDVVAVIAYGKKEYGYGDAFEDTTLNQTTAVVRYDTRSTNKCPAYPFFPLGGFKTIAGKELTDQPDDCVSNTELFAAHTNDQTKAKVAAIMFNNAKDFFETIAIQGNDVIVATFSTEKTILPRSLPFLLNNKMHNARMATLIVKGASLIEVTPDIKIAIFTQNDAYNYTATTHQRDGQDLSRILISRTPKKKMTDVAYQTILTRKQTEQSQDLPANATLTHRPFRSDPTARHDERLWADPFGSVGRAQETACDRWEDRLPRTVPVEMAFPRIERHRISISKTLETARYDTFVVPSTADVGDVRFALYTQEEAASFLDKTDDVDANRDTFDSPVLHPLQGVYQGSPVVRMLTGAAQIIAGKMGWTTIREDATSLTKFTADEGTVDVLPEMVSSLKAVVRVKLCARVPDRATNEIRAAGLQTSGPLYPFKGAWHAWSHSSLIANAKAQKNRPGATGVTQSGLAVFRQDTAVTLVESLLAKRSYVHTDIVADAPYDDDRSEIILKRLQRDLASGADLYAMPGWQHPLSQMTYGDYKELLEGGGMSMIKREYGAVFDRFWHRLKRIVADNEVTKWTQWHTAEKKRIAASASVAELLTTTPPPDVYTFVFEIDWGYKVSVDEGQQQQALVAELASFDMLHLHKHLVTLTDEYSRLPYLYVFGRYGSMKSFSTVVNETYIGKDGDDDMTDTATFTKAELQQAGRNTKNEGLFQTFVANAVTNNVPDDFANKRVYTTLENYGVVLKRENFYKLENRFLDLASWTYFGYTKAMFDMWMSVMFTALLNTVAKNAREQYIRMFISRYDGTYVHVADDMYLQSTSTTIIKKPNDDTFVLHKENNKQMSKFAVYIDETYSGALPPVLSKTFNQRTFYDKVFGRTGSACVRIAKDGTVKGAQPCTEHYNCQVYASFLHIFDNADSAMCAPNVPSMCVVRENDPAQTSPLRFVDCTTTATSKHEILKRKGYVEVSEFFDCIDNNVGDRTWHQNVPGANTCVYVAGIRPVSVAVVKNQDGKTKGIFDTIVNAFRPLKAMIDWLELRTVPQGICVMFRGHLPAETSGLNSQNVYMHGNVELSLEDITWFTETSNEENKEAAKQIIRAYEQLATRVLDPTTKAQLNVNNTADEVLEVCGRLYNDDGAAKKYYKRITKEIVVRQLRTGTIDGHNVTSVSTISARDDAYYQEALGAFDMVAIDNGDVAKALRTLKEQAEADEQTRTAYITVDDARRWRYQVSDEVAADEARKQIADSTSAVVPFMSSRGGWVLGIIDSQVCGVFDPCETSSNSRDSAWFEGFAKRVRPKVTSVGLTGTGGTVCTLRSSANQVIYALAGVHKNGVGSVKDWMGFAPVDNDLVTGVLEVDVKVEKEAGVRAGVAAVDASNLNPAQSVETAVKTTQQKQSGPAGKVAKSGNFVKSLAAGSTSIGTGLTAQQLPANAQTSPGTSPLQPKAAPTTSTPKNAADVFDNFIQNTNVEAKPDTKDYATLKQQLQRFGKATTINDIITLWNIAFPSEAFTQSNRTWSQMYKKFDRHKTALKSH